MGRQPAELATSSYRLLVHSLTRSSARLCFMMERGLALPHGLNTVLSITDASFLSTADATEVDCTAPLKSNVSCYMRGLPHGIIEPAVTVSRLGSSNLSRCTGLKQACSGCRRSAADVVIATVLLSDRKRSTPGESSGSRLKWESCMGRRSRPGRTFLRGGTRKRLPGRSCMVSLLGGKRCIDIKTRLAELV